MSFCKSAEGHHNDFEDCDAQTSVHTSDITPLPFASIPLTSHIPQSDSGICLTPQGQGDVASPQQQTDSRISVTTGIGSCDGVPSPPGQKDAGISLTPSDISDVLSLPPEQKDNDVDFSTFEQGSHVSLPPEEKDASSSLSQSDQDSELLLPEQNALPLEEKTPERNSSSVQQHTKTSLLMAPTQTVHKEEEKEDEEHHVGVSKSEVAVSAPDSTSETLQISSSAHKQSKTDSSSNHPARMGSDEPRSRLTTPEHQRVSRSHLQGKSSNSKTPDNFTFQTKYLVLQFLHQATSEQHLLPLSQNSVSTTSESEPRFKSHSELLRQHWQDSRSHSSPISPVPNRRHKPLSKTKGSRSSPNLKDSDFFKDSSTMQIPTRRKKIGPSPKKAVKSNRRSPIPSKQDSLESTFFRSVSQNTENSEHGTYCSDADDELDTSFDSSHQGSTTSISFRSRLSRFHEQQARGSRVHLPTVFSDAESLPENSLSVAEESIMSPVDDEKTLPILSLDQINLEQLPVSSDMQQARVNEYLVTMSGSSTADPDTSLKNYDEAGEDEVDSPPFNKLTHMDQTPTNSAHQSQNVTEDEVLSMGFDPQETHSDPVVETEEGACGGVDPGEVSGDCGDWDLDGPVLRGDRTRLTLDLSVPPDDVLMDAVLTLQQEIEEEISSFESECEEALQSLHSDNSWFSHASGINLGRSLSPETAEAARILARIGDDIQQRHFEHLQGAVGRFMLDNCAGIFTYENFRDAALTALDKDLNGWRQVATLLLYSQHVALQLTRCGRKGLHRVVDYTVQLLADTAADFIIQHGGWHGISSSIPSSPDGTAPPGGTQHNPFHSHFNISSSIGERSSSAPDLTCALQHHTTPDDGMTPTPNDQATQEEEKNKRPESATAGGAAHSVAAGIAAPAHLESEDIAGVDCPDSASKAALEKGEDGGENEEGGGSGEGAVSGSGSSVVNASMVAKTAASVALLAIGAALAFNFSRGYT